MGSSMDGFDAADMTVIFGPDREVQLIHRMTGVCVESRMLPTMQLNYVAALTDLRVMLAGPAEIDPAVRSGGDAARQARMWYFEVLVLAIVFMGGGVAAVAVVF